ncbi:hypothetical protein Tco_1124177 [Tanacetum coccineum]|uniref:Uncharacterized protein n=1 Tax=Tanacetum coccineum TaxID=301880 RepID=A0ABQ5J5D7_9ASTR
MHRVPQYLTSKDFTARRANARRNNEKALNILLSAIPDRHLLSFHDAVDARSLWKAIKARFGGNEASKKMQKNLLKQQFETFTIGSREELDSAYERSTACPTVFLTQMNSYFPFFAQQASMLTTHGLEGGERGEEGRKRPVCKLNEDAMEEIDIRSKAHAIGQDGLGDFDWSNKADDAPVSLALMATNSERKGIQSSTSPTGTIIPPRANVSFTGIDELAIRNKSYWVDSDDEETDISESQKETVFNTENSEESFENRSPKSQNSVGQESRTKGLGNKGGKLCFVCYSPNHLIKDCNLHERTSQHTQTHKSKGTQGSRGTRPVWNNIQRVNHSNFARNSRNPHQRRSFIPSAVLTRDGLISTVRPKMTQAVPSKSTANVTYQGAARSRVPQAVLSRSTDGSYYPRLDSRRPRISRYSPSSRSSTTRTPHRPQRPKKNFQNKHGNQKEHLDSVNRGNGSYTLKQFEYVTPLGNPEKISRTMLSLTWMLWKYDRRQRIKLSELKSSKVVMCALEMTLKNIIPSGESLCGIARQHKMKLPMAQKTGGKSTSNINEL